jgi:hypothetical protein
MLTSRLLSPVVREEVDEESVSGRQSIPVQPVAEFPLYPMVEASSNKLTTVSPLTNVGTLYSAADDDAPPDRPEGMCTGLEKKGRSRL